jgi:hypothetical protein
MGTRVIGNLLHGDIVKSALCHQLHRGFDQRRSGCKAPFAAQGVDSFCRFYLFFLGIFWHDFRSLTARSSSAPLKSAAP